MGRETNGSSLPISRINTAPSGKRRRMVLNIWVTLACPQASNRWKRGKTVWRVRTRANQSGNNLFCALIVMVPPYAGAPARSIKRLRSN